MGVKVLKQKPSQADAILPCVSLSFHRLQVPTVQCNSAANLFYSWPLPFFFSLSLEEKKRRRGKEVEEAAGGEGSQMSLHRNVRYQQEVTVTKSSSLLLSYSKESLIDL